MDTIEDYRRVRFEEYASGLAFALGTLVFGYWTFDGMINDQNTFSTLLSCYLTVGCGFLAESSFEQGRVMSGEVSKLERKLEDNQL